MKKQALLLPALLSSLFMGQTAFAAGPANSPWPMFRHDAQHTSSTTAVGPSYPRVEWTASPACASTTNVRPGAGVSLDESGNVYAGMSGCAVKYGPSGSLQWSKSGSGALYAQPAVTNDGYVFLSSRSYTGLQNEHGLDAFLLNGNLPDPAVLDFNLFGQSLVGGGAPMILSTGNVYVANRDETFNFNPVASSYNKNRLAEVVAFGAPSSGAVSLKYLIVQHDSSPEFDAFYGTDTRSICPAITPDGSSQYYSYEWKTVGPGNYASHALRKYYDSTGNSDDVQNNFYFQAGVVARPTGDACFFYNDGSVFGPLRLRCATDANNITVTKTDQDFDQPGGMALGGSTLYVTDDRLDPQIYGATLFAIDLATGGTKWAYSTASTDFSGTNASVPTLSAGGTVYFTYKNNDFLRLVALNAENGSEIWNIAVSQTDYSEIPNQPVPGPDNKLYIKRSTTIVSIADQQPASIVVTLSTTALSLHGEVTVGVQVTPAAAGYPLELRLSTNPVTYIGIMPYEYIQYDGLNWIRTAWTDASGHAQFRLNIDPRVQFAGTVDPFISTVTIRLGGIRRETAMSVNGNRLDHFDVVAPTQAPVGGSFNVSVYARNHAGDYLSSTNTVNLVPILAGTSDITGSGSLSATQLSVAAGTGTVSLSYNRVETVQIKAVHATQPSIIGYSAPVAIVGPHHFSVLVPTNPVLAANPFRLIVEAQDSTNQRVVGYSGTVSLSAVNAATTTIAGIGTLGVTSLNIGSGVGVLETQTYSKPESIRVKALDSALGVSGLSTPLTVYAEPSPIESYSVQLPTGVTVGLPFSMTVTALGVGGSTVSYANLPTHFNIVTLLSGTEFSGSGSLGVMAGDLPAGSTYTVVSPQTYNKIETIQLKVIDENGKVGLSPPLAVGGPSTFAIDVPTGTVPAGQAFRMTVIAKDPGGNPVTGYTGTVNVLAVKASDPNTPGTGALGVTSLPMSGGIGNTDFQTYSKGEGIRIKIHDPVLGVSAVSSSFTVTVPASLISHYSIDAPAQATVGLPFAIQINALDTSSSPVSYASLDTNLSISAVLSGTDISGSGSLGAGSAVLVAGSTFVIVSPQTYNKIETVQLLVTDASGKRGLSAPITITGPTTFSITVPTDTVASGQAFRMTVLARDAGGNQVVGYTGTVNVLAVKASDSNTPGTGSLGVASLAMSGGIGNTDFQTYSKGEGIRIKIHDPILNVSAVSSSFTVTAPIDGTDHYVVTVPIGVTVGLAFSMTVTAQDASNNPVTYSLPKNITLQTLLNGTEVAGSGSLGIPLVTLAANQSFVASASQSYNKIETVQIRATDENGKTGLSGPIVFSGPTAFVVTVPTSPVTAGAPFTLAVEARDAGNNRVLGYNGSVALSAVNPDTPTISGAGILGIASLSLSSGAATVSQTYTRAETFKVKALDSALSVTGLSSTMTVRAGAPVSVSLAANPGSLILGQTSALSATVRDFYANAVAGSTVTFTVTTGSGTLAWDSAGLVSSLASTAAVTGANGQAAVVFGLPAGLTQAQKNVVHATLPGLQASATIYVSVLITRAGGVAVQSDDPRTMVVVPANAFSYDISVDIKSKPEVAPDIAAKIANAFAKGTGQFVKDFAKHIRAFKESSDVDAGSASAFVDLQFPFDLATSTTVSVESLGARGPSVRIQGILVPASILRVYKLNEAEDLWEQVADGNIADTANKLVKAKVKTLSGVYTLGAPPSQDVAPTASATISNALANGATVQVDIAAGTFGTATRVTVNPVASASLPLVTGGASNLLGTGIGLSLDASGLQPAQRVKITVSYTASQATGFNEAFLRLARFDTGLNTWILLDSQVDTRTKRVIGFTDHFSLFQVVQVRPQASLSEARVYPNPFRPQLGHKTVTFDSLTANATIKVFTVSGRFLKELTADGTGRIVWDVKDRDGSALPSGVFLAFIESGGNKRTVKFAVQK